VRKNDHSSFRIFVPNTIPVFQFLLIKAVVYFSGMEIRYKCCQSIHKAFVSSSKLINDPALAGSVAKVRAIFFLLKIVMAVVRSTTHGCFGWIS
jgi:hypothetical protein